MFKIFTVLGTRPEIIKLSRIINIFDKFFNHKIIHTGQNFDYELNQIFFKELQIRKPNLYLNCAKKTSIETISEILVKFEKLILQDRPDAIFVLGDTNSAFASLVAKKNKIPIFHYEAGNRCFDNDVPEEINRKIVDHISDFNFTYTEISKQNLIREGIQAEKIVNIGSPMKEVLDFYKPQIDNSDILQRLNLSKGKFFVVSAHREENVDVPEKLLKFIEALNAIGDLYNIPIIFSTHPRTRQRIEGLKIRFHKNIQLLKPLGFNDYNHLQQSSKAVLSDSGTISEESSILNFPALNIRDNHERPEGMEEASVMMVGLGAERILQGLRILENQKVNIDKDRLFREVYDYSMPNVSDKLVRIIHSYTDYVNQVIWKKY